MNQSIKNKNQKNKKQEEIKVNTTIQTIRKAGTITVITGPMFSEKSGELIRRLLKLEKYGRQRVKAYKPAEDQRFSSDEIVSRIGYRFPATNIPQQLTPEIVESILRDAEDYHTIAFDEAQFFSEEIIYVVEELAYRGKDVILDGLNMDFRGRVFGPMGELLAMADDTVKLTAFCARCGSPNGTHTQRIVNGKPAKSGPIIVIGDTESYEPRCRTCFVPPTKA
jgi:thymidine kinase